MCDRFRPGSRKRLSDSWRSFSFSWVSGSLPCRRRGPRKRIRGLIVRQANQYLTATLSIGRLEGSVLRGIAAGRRQRRTRRSDADSDRANRAQLQHSRARANRRRRASRSIDAPADRRRPAAGRALGPRRTRPARIARAGAHRVRAGRSKCNRSKSSTAGSRCTIHSISAPPMCRPNSRR